MTILEALDAHALATPDALALDDMSYGELRLRSRRVAAALRQRGIAGGERIVLYAENSHAFVYAYLGALRAGAVVVPANVLYREADLTRIVEDSAAVALCASTRSRAFVPARLRVTVIALEDVSAWTADATLDSTAQEPRSADELAVLVYTSGTTGRAKGAMLTHANLLAIAGQLIAAWRWTAHDTLLLTLPLFHVHGLCAGLGGSFVAGARLRLRERFVADDVIATLEAGDATMFFGVPTMYVRLLETERAIAFRNVRLFVSGSAALPASVHAAFAERFGSSILERYGSTEFGFALTNRYEGPRYAGTVGFPFPGVAVRLIAKDEGDVMPGEIGESERLRRLLARCRGYGASVLPRCGRSPLVS
jgi:malonyl-CoA/methylmalonyl-CoA synthetase